MRRAFKWILGILTTLLTCAALVVGAAFWTLHHRDAAFTILPPGARQLAIYDAFARALELNYYDREFVDHDWPKLRDQWRTEAAKTRNDFDVYFKVLLPLTNKLPSSHLAAVPPSPPASSPNDGKPALSASSLSGLEVALVRRDKGVSAVVDSIAPGSPAAAAGIEPGWRVLSFESCGNARQVTASFQIVGSPEERLTLEISNALTIVVPAVNTAADFDARYQKTITYTCVAETRRAPFETRDIGGVTYLRFDTFLDRKVIDQVMATLDRPGAGGVIIDLRSNHGGLRDEMLRLAGRLLPEGALVGTQVTRGIRTAFRASGAALMTRPLVILIGPSSASGAEILAAALQDNRRARLLGRPTSGQTLTADDFPLPDGGHAQVAFADFVRANGKHIEAVGVFPDIPIMPTIADVRAGRDPALDRALAELAPKVASARSGNPPRPE